jgi:hypothetical protein
MALMRLLRNHTIYFLLIEYDVYLLEFFIDKNFQLISINVEISAILPITPNTGFQPVFCRGVACDAHPAAGRTPLRSTGFQPVIFPETPGRPGKTRQ